MKLTYTRLSILFIFLFISLNPANARDKPAYFQQHVAYTIHVKLDDVHHSLSADESVIYTNNSPDTLKIIYFHLWPNGYRNNRTPFARQRIAEGLKDFHDAGAADRGYIDSLDFRADGKKIQIQYADKSHEIARLILNTALLPGQSVTISTPFYVKIPKAFSRMGHTGQAYYISQWYPKPAVYDRNGWNTFPYLDQGEFYSEFGSFDVSITLPENYVVAATGRLQNASERAWLNSIAKNVTEKDTGRSEISFGFKLKKKKSKNENEGFPASSSTMKNIEYYQDSVHDFAWFADKRYLVEKTDVILGSGRKVDCWAMYTPDQKKLWRGSCNAVAKTISFYSDQVGEYPYPSATAVSGDLMPSAGGMEYPMVTVISTKQALEEVIVHEVGHNWFYGILGSNERQYPWMDEGINSFYEHLYYDRKFTLEQYFKTAHKGFKTSSFNEFAIELGSVVFESRLGLDQPVELPATAFTQLNYGSIVYAKTAGIMRYMYFYLGKEKFSSLMHEYFSKWKFKHPMPEDIRKIFENEAGKDVSCFFNDLLTTDKKIDYGITSVKKEGNNYNITIKNTGSITAPVFAAIGDKDSVLKDTVIYNPSKSFNLLLSSGQPAKYAIINPFPLSPDVYFANNQYRIDPPSGRFKPLKFRAFFGIESPDKTNVLWAPAIAWNNQDKWMLGAGFSSDLLPPKRLSYQLLPLFAFGSKTVTGMGRVSYRFNPYSARMRHYIEIGINAKRFSFDETVHGIYNKIEPFISWEFQHKPLEGSMKHQVIVRSTHIFNQMEAHETRYSSASYPAKLLVNELSYSIQKGPAVHSFYAGATLQNIQGKTNRITAELILNRPAPVRNHQISFRIFAGMLLGNSPEDDRYYIPLGGIGGYQDFANNNLYLDRTGRDRVFGQQIESDGGGFKFITNNSGYSTGNWMVTSNFSIDLLKPLKLYIDGGIFSDTLKNVRTAYSAGISLSLLKGNVEVYFPLVYSAELGNWLKSQHPGYGRQITFKINIKALDPKKLPGYLGM